MKKLKYTLVLLAMAALLAACGSSEASESGDSDQKVVKIGATPDGYPQYFKEDGELKGFSVDVIEAIYEELGYEVQWEVTDWTGVLASMETGKIDTVANFAATPERGEKYNFSDPYYNSKAVLATGEDQAEISFDELKKGQIAVIMGTNYPNVLTAAYPDEEFDFVTYESADVVYSDVGSGKIDAFVHGREILAAQVNEKGLPLRVVGEPFGDQPVALPFKKTEEGDKMIEEVNGALEKLREDSTISELSEKWYGMDLLEDSNTAQN
ncbi:transporter substrate-binding domain-containing protein [Bhargavaea ginsengi]|uniref:transporter substrate-binding domain-containing protein n=1 Tax=Bhargavaea ginsengi TaxID=426757 RepID=UPI00203F083A|nr:transporter substrate-binding domain-containing protein [Bhargavaea ginsengi]MCM3086700.1 transporter substrate-binding domain-containing protein [Bhargavaea ginsengi]